MSKALLIIDIQNDYFENGAMVLVGSDKASQNAKLVLESFRNNDLPVVHIQHINNGEDATFFLPETKGAEIHENVKPEEGETLIVKHYPNSFRETELLDHLRSNDITDLVIVGMMTQMCVDATTRAAKDFGFNCTVLGDACATLDLEVNNKKVKAANVQTAFLAGLNSFYSKVTTTKSYLKESNSKE